MLVIDCHAHIYSPDEKRYQPKDRPLRPGGRAAVEDLRRVSEANGVQAVRAIQTISFYGYDNRYLCDSAKANRSWLRGVCTLDPDDPHSPGLLRQFARDYGVASLRSVPSPSRKTGFDDPGVRELWKMAASEGLTVDIFLMRLDMVPSATKLLQEFPKMTVGFCHCMDLKPGPLLAPSLEAVLALSRFRNLHPKVDFIGTGTTKKFPCEDLHEPCLKIIDAYGPERCVWTSCFPNDLWTPKITYAEHLRIFTEVLPLKTEARRMILGETARRLWFPELKA
jgi:L-fuconolactonase